MEDLIAVGQARAPGCMHLVLEAVSPRPPYALENRSGQPLRYRQAGLPDLPHVPLPAFSAAGFAWQKDRSAGGVPQVPRRFLSGNLLPKISRRDVVYLCFDRLSSS